MSNAKHITLNLFLDVVKSCPDLHVKELSNRYANKNNHTANLFLCYVLCCTAIRGGGVGCTVLQA